MATNNQALWFPSLADCPERTALIDGETEISYRELRAYSERLRGGLLNGEASLDGERVAFLYPASIEYAGLFIAVIAAGGLAVPLSVHAAPEELRHCLDTAGCRRLLLADNLRSDALDAVCEDLSITQLAANELPDLAPAAPALTDDQKSLMVFTSGTTGKPKGVVHTLASLRAQITSLIDAWGWSHDDRIPLFLPLHHVHGIVNVLCCALWSGAAVSLFRRFDAEIIGRQVADGRFNVFMAVPTIYVKLIAYLDALSAEDREAITHGFQAMRLNVSGSAACPVSVFERWQALTDQPLLERYGMTELGMALSNPYRGERRPGHVGQPLPGVVIKRVDEAGNEITDSDVPGELAVKSPTSFCEYWERPDATEEAFNDGWFLTGDIAVIDDGYYRILGRASIDIIKSGGYKLSALEIEAALLEHPSISEIAVIGIPDDEWGEVVAAAVVADSDFDAGAVSEWCADKLSSYKVPRRWQVTGALPRNAMGKVTKPDLRSWF